MPLAISVPNPLIDPSLIGQFENLGLAGTRAPTYDYADVVLSDGDGAVV